jgi:hypothetical protein
MATTTKRADFEAIFPALAQEILTSAKEYGVPEAALQWFEKVIPLWYLIVIGESLLLTEILPDSPSMPTSPEVN